ncbi:MAG: hypothetical protein MUF78_06400 [Candidatus Edwardsbacteria bacterium]|jgi:tetratricopeptide (TPR) repeat protein|nr:hypothetical protein [Candidatus Edwardsbacteria bacterium]
MKKQATIIALCLTAIVSGCGKSGSNGTTAPVTELTAAEHLAQGWTSFNAGSFSAAQTSFGNAIAKDSTLADAYNGRGWCQGILGSPASALSSFATGATRTGTAVVLNEITAGMAFSYAAMDSAAKAVTSASSVLLADNDWQFSHTYRASQDNVLNYLELCLLLAQNHFKLGQFTQAEDFVQLLHPGFDVDETTPAGQAQLQAEIELQATLF